MAIDEETLKKTRKVAVEKNTTLSELVRKYLEGLAAQEDQSKENAILELKRIFSDKTVVVGRRRWKREQGACP